MSELPKKKQAYAIKNYLLPTATAKLNSRDGSFYTRVTDVIPVNDHYSIVIVESTGNGVNEIILGMYFYDIPGGDLGA